MAARLSLIAAMAANRVIGLNNRMPWHLPDDLKRFKALTLGHPLVMGRKTFESLGGPLPGRAHFVVSRAPGLALPGATVLASLEAALAAADDGVETFVIGGASVYAQALPGADRLYLTEIRRAYRGDAFFPDFDRTQWREAERVAHPGCGDRPAFDCVVYERVPGARGHGAPEPGLQEYDSQKHDSQGNTA